MGLQRSETMAEQAYNLLRQQGRVVNEIYHTPKFVKRTNQTKHLFRGKEHGVTVRFEGTVIDSRLTELREISTYERKKIGKGTDGMTPPRKASAVRPRSTRYVHVLAMSLINYAFWAEKDPGEGYGEVLHRLARDPRARKDVLELREQLPHGLSDRHAVNWIHGMLHRAGLSNKDPWVVCCG